MILPMSSLGYLLGTGLEIAWISAIGVTPFCLATGTATADSRMAPMAREFGLDLGGQKCRAGHSDGSPLTSTVNGSVLTFPLRRTCAHTRYMPGSGKITFI